MRHDQTTTGRRPLALRGRWRRRPSQGGLRERPTRGRLIAPRGLKKLTPPRLALTVRECSSPSVSGALVCRSDSISLPKEGRGRSPARAASLLKDRAHQRARRRSRIARLAFRGRPGYADRAPGLGVLTIADSRHALMKGTAHLPSGWKYPPVLPKSLPMTTPEHDATEATAQGKSSRRTLSQRRAMIRRVGRLRPQRSVCATRAKLPKVAVPSKSHKTLKGRPSSVRMPVAKSARLRKMSTEDDPSGNSRASRVRRKQREQREDQAKEEPHKAQP